MSRRARAGLVLALGVAAAVIAHLIDPDNTSDDLALLAAGIVMGELLVLRLEDGSAIPLSYAVMLVLASSFAADEFVIAVVVAELVALVVRPTEHSWSWRVKILATRFIVAGATLAAYRGVREMLDHKETVAAVLGALGAAALAQVLADVVMRTCLGLGRSFSPRGRLAWLAIASSGMLMAIGYRGVDGEGDIGIWGPLLFATPLLAAWYAFERLDSATLAYRQTIESLAMAPEMGGIVPAGHAQRVARLVVSMGDHLGLAPTDITDLEMAALLHHLGQVTLDDPEVAGAPAPGEVASVTGGMLREIRPLAGAGEIVAGESDEPRRRLEVQVLRLASEYDDLTVVDGTPSDVAIETLRSAPGFVYEERVLGALERAVRGLNSAAR